MDCTTERHGRLLALLAVLALLAAACGGGAQQAAEPDNAGAATGAGDTGSAATGGASPAADNELLSETYDLSGTTVRFGSKDFTEQLILGQLARHALEAAGAKVELTEQLPSPAGAREAMLAGELDATWEYTGTAWINYLNHDEAISDPMEQFQAVKEEDLRKNNVFWSPPAPFDDTYGITARREFAEEHNLETLEDVARFVEENPDQATLCLDSTFGSRDDGLPSMEETYNFTWPDNKQIVSDFGVIYDSTDKGDPCNFGEVFTTDGRIKALDLKLFEDTQNAFISYLSSVTMPKSFQEQHPELPELFEAIGADITEEVMTDLNARVDVDGEFPEDVALQYLQEQGFIE